MDEHGGDERDIHGAVLFMGNESASVGGLDSMDDLPTGLRDETTVGTEKHGRAAVADLLQRDRERGSE